MHIVSVLLLVSLQGNEKTESIMTLDILFWELKSNVNHLNINKDKIKDYVFSLVDIMPAVFTSIFQSNCQCRSLKCLCCSHYLPWWTVEVLVPNNLFEILHLIKGRGKIEKQVWKITKLMFLFSWQEYYFLPDKHPWVSYYFFRQSYSFQGCQVYWQELRLCKLKHSNLN